MTAKKTTRRKFFIIRVDDVDVRVLATNYAQARRNARAGQGRVVGVYFS